MSVFQTSRWPHLTSCFVTSIALITFLFAAAPLIADTTTTTNIQPQASQDYLRQIKVLIADDKYEEAMSLAGKWEAVDPEDPDLAAIKANLLVMAPEAQPRIVINQYPEGTAAAPDDVHKPIQILDGTTSAAAGYIGEVVPDERKVAIGKAVNLLKKTVQKHPDRLDIRMGVSQLYALDDNFDAVLKNLEETAKYAADKKFQGLLWAEGKPAKDPEDLLSDSMHHYYIQYTQGFDNPDDKTAFRFAELATRYFPKDIRTWNNLCAEYAQRDELPKAVEALMKAHELDKSDTIVLMNIGHLYELMEKPAEAIKYYQKVADMNDPNHAEAAREKLAELKKEKE